MFNHSLSPGLQSYVERRLRQLRDINPEITMEPLRTRSHQYPRRSRPRIKLQEKPCALCRLVHPGDCD